MLLSAFEHLEGAKVRAGFDEIAPWAKREAGQQPLPGKAGKEGRRAGEVGQQCGVQEERSDSGTMGSGSRVSLRSPMP